jgi:hypothetical protein
MPAPRQSLLAFTALVAVATILLLAVPAPAGAAKNPSGASTQVSGSGGSSSAGDSGNAIRAGENLGRVVKSWGAQLLLGIAGFMGLIALVTRNVGEGVKLVALVVLIGGFVFADDTLRNFVSSLWGSLGLAG